MRLLFLIISVFNVLSLGIAQETSEKKINGNISYLKEHFPAQLDELLGLVKAYFKNLGLDSERVASDYLKMIKDMRTEGLYFYKHGKYRCDNQHIANEYVYSKPEVMTYYMNALLVSQVMWKHHFNIFMYFQSHLKTLFEADSDLNILDIGPGFSPKIELALKLLGYKEKLTVLDKSPTALSGLRDFLYMIDFSYELNTICDDLFAVKNLYFNLVTANHLFDDLLIDAYCSLKQISPEYLYESEKGLIEATFEISQTYDMTSLICRTSCVLSQLVEENGFLLLRHYQGLTEKALGLNSWFEFVNLFFINVIDELQRGEFSIIQRKNGFVLLKKNNSFKKDSL